MCVLSTNDYISSKVDSLPARQLSLARRTVIYMHKTKDLILLIAPHKRGPFSVTRLHFLYILQIIYIFYTQKMHVKSVINGKNVVRLEKSDPKNAKTPFFVYFYNCLCIRDTMKIRFCFFKIQPISHFEKHQDFETESIFCQKKKALKACFRNRLESFLRVQSKSGRSTEEGAILSSNRYRMITRSQQKA